MNLFETSLPLTRQVLLMAGNLKNLPPKPLPGYVLKIEGKYKSQMRKILPGAKAK
jgi:hypothetical protein